MQSFPSTNVQHVAGATILVCLQFFVAEESAAYYRLVLRPRIVADGAVPCGGHAPAVPEYVPADCDLVSISTVGDDVVETYHSRAGVAVTTVHLRGGKWNRTETSYLAAKRSLILPGLAFAAFGFATIRKMVRTQSFFSWQLARHPADRLEQIIYIYTVPVFVASILLTALGR